VVEAGETFIGGEEAGLRGGRARGKKVLTGIAVEVREPKGIGRCRMAVLADASAASLHPFVTGNVRPGTRVITDAWQGYRGLDGLGYAHERRSQRAARARGGVCQIFCARGLFAVRFREFIPNRFLALSDAVLPGLSRGSAEPDFPCRSGADAACPGFPGVLCCCGCLLPDPPGIVWRAIPVCH
jgi:hypothetical protein